MSEPTPPPSATPAAEAAPEPRAADGLPPAAIAAPAAPATRAVTRRSFLEGPSVRPTLIVAIIIASLFYGTRVLNEALPTAASEVPVSASGSVVIGQGATIIPLAGWSASAHEGGDAIRLEKGIVAVDLFVESFGSSAVELAAAYRDEFLAADTTQFTATTIEPFTAGDGSRGARFRYQGLFTGVDVAIEGEVAVLLDDGLGVVADAWTRHGDLDEALGEIHRMIQSIELRP